MSNASDELTKTGVVVDLPSQLERQAVSLDALKTSVVSDIPSSLEVQLSELKGIKDSVSDVTTTLSMNSKELLMHDGRLTEQGHLLTELNRLIKGKLL